MLDIHEGERFDGFCSGFFGRDSYGLKVVEAVGHDWLAVRDYTFDEKEGIPNMTRFGNHKQMLREVAEWRKREDA